MSELASEPKSTGPFPERQRREVVAALAGETARVVHTLRVQR